MSDIALAYESLTPLAYRLYYVLCKCHSTYCRTKYKPTSKGNRNIFKNLTITIIDVFWIISMYMLLLLQICQCIVLLKMEEAQKEVMQAIK
jgi:hypothetical protein